MSEIDWLDDDKERGLEITAMTNREWLESLSDAQLAELIYCLEDYAHCEFCADDGKCRNSDTIVQDCLGGLEKWLKQEHKSNSR